MKNNETTTIYLVNLPGDDWVALSDDALDAFDTDCGIELDRLSTLSSNRLDANYALEYQIPSEWLPELEKLKPEYWREIENFVNERGYEEKFEANRDGSWDYRFEKSL